MKFTLRQPYAQTLLLKSNILYYKLSHYFFKKGLELRCKTLTAKTFRYYKLNLNQTLRY